jgi:hypothetical protein
MQFNPRHTSNGLLWASTFADLTAAWSLKYLASMMMMGCPDESTRISYSCKELSSSDSVNFTLDF